ncbi:MAG: 1,2-phenylacetyl-CoA epoxidase, subunit [Pseudomonadota bacterium]
MSAAQATLNHTLPVDYWLHLADNALVLGQRNAEWCGHGPILEEDIALSNNSLDLVGQARLLYQEAAAQMGNGATEDTLAFFRDVPDFKNYTLLELPHHAPLAGTSASERDFATTLVRNFLYSALMVLVWWPQLLPSHSKKCATTCAIRAIGCCAWAMVRLNLMVVHKRPSIT